MMADVVKKKATVPTARLSLKGKIWQQTEGDTRLALTLAQRHAIPPILGNLLTQRGVHPDEAEQFLNPRIKDQLPDPALLKDMVAGAALIVEAIKHKKKIALFGDYDVDGATSTALMARFLKTYGLEPILYIPDRVEEGYGPSTDAVASLKSQDTQIIIFMDCGTLAFDALEKAKSLKLQTIVLDHHKQGDKLPVADAIINPNRLDESDEVVEKCGHMAAVGVTFLFLVELNRQLRQTDFYKETNLIELLDLVATGTVCDVVSLTGINRAFVAQGLHLIRQGKNLGLRVLRGVAGTKEIPSTYDLGFVLGPRLNAGGRIGIADAAVTLLTTEDASKAQELAEMLDSNNRRRQEMQEEAVEQAINQVEKNQQDQPVIFVVGDWHQGVVGLVAGRLKEIYGKPAFAFTAKDTGGILKGSARSVPGIDVGGLVLEALEKNFLKAGGGHASAAGLSLEPDALDGFQEFITQQLNELPNLKELLQPVLRLDARLALSAVSIELANHLGQLEPCGESNRKPKFWLEKVRISYARDLKGKHVSCTLQDDLGNTVKAICFRCGDTPLGQALLRARDERFDIAGTLKKDHWQGRTTVKFFIEDMRAC